MALRNLGIGDDGLENFCMAMSMNKPMTRNNYQKIVNSLHDSYIAEAEKSMKNAAPPPALLLPCVPHACP